MLGLVRGQVSICNIYSCNITFISLCAFWKATGCLLYHTGTVCKSFGALGQWTCFVGFLSEIKLTYFIEYRLLLLMHIFCIFPESNKKKANLKCVLCKGYSTICILFCCCCFFFFCVQVGQVSDTISFLICIK